MENLNIEIGLPIAWEIEGNDDITLRYIPAGKKAIGFHKGAYSELVTMFERLTRFITEKGYNPSGLSMSTITIRLKKCRKPNC
jgi:effector-binding domain-containing protein